MNPKRYTAEEHGISIQEIDPDALYVIERLRLSGHQAYLVGGGVRDLLLGAKPKDFDVSTSAKPEEVRRLFRNAILIGRRFRLVHVRFGKKIIEVATFRSGENESSELIVRDNEWGTEEEDVLRRDFTINGLFYDPQEEVVIDYVDGYLDIQKKILRTIGTPEARFSQDPVRMIRLVKFCARFNLEIDPLTFEALLSCQKEIVKSSPARILEELLRMLESGSSKAFFHLLHQYGFLHSLMPELAHFFTLKGEETTLRFLEEIDRKVKEEDQTIDRSLLLAILLFPLFDTFLQEQQKMEEKPMHLGMIESSAYHAIDCIFSHFFLLPRKIRAIMAIIMTAQYRFVPLDRKLPRHPRPPKDPLAHLSLELFLLRGKVDPEIEPHIDLWTRPKEESSLENQAIPKPRRRRRR